MDLSAKYIHLSSPLVQSTKWQWVEILAGSGKNRGFSTVRWFSVSQVKIPISVVPGGFSNPPF